MSNNFQKILKNNVRMLEADLSNKEIELLNHMKEAAATEYEVECIKAQLGLVKTQLEKLNG